MIGASSRTYPSLPTRAHHVEIHVSGDRIQIAVDGYEPAAIRISDGSYAGGSIGMKIKSGTAYFQDVYVTPMEDYYTEEYRPQYHYSPIRGSASDPNGLVYFEGSIISSIRTEASGRMRSAGIWCIGTGCRSHCLGTISDMSGRVPP